MAVPLTDEDRAFLQGYDPSAFPRPSLAVDVVVLTASEGRLQAVLTRRTEPPFRGRWSVPGVFVRLDEPLEAAARRALGKVGLPGDLLSTGPGGGWLEQLYTFGAPGRDPRGRVVSVAYFGLVPPDRLAVGPRGRVVPLEVPWAGEAGGPVGAEGLGPLAFDHADVLGLAVQRLRGKLAWSPIAYALLPERFPLRALQALHETVLGRRLNKDSFRRRMTATGQLAPTGEREPSVGHRPAELYRHVPATGGALG